MSVTKFLSLVALATVLSTTMVVGPQQVEAQVLDIDNAVINPRTLGGFTWSTGQSFTALGQFLDSFSFWVGSGDIVFTAYVGVWSSDRVSSILWSGGSQIRPNNNFSRETFTPAISMTLGGTYAAFLVPVSGTANIFSGTNTYAGGSMIQTTGDPFSSPWGTITTGEDAYQFQAIFSGSVVPEPSTWLLLCTGLLGLGIVARRRKNEEEEL